MSFIEQGKNGKFKIPEELSIAYFEGDGIGPDICNAAKPVIEKAVELGTEGKVLIDWKQTYVGEQAVKKSGKHLPDEALDIISKTIISLKGPLTTPVGGGFRSLTVTLRKIFDLYANIRPFKHMPGVYSPIKKPESVDIVLFRENTEDVYAGIEWSKGSEEVTKMINFLKNTYNVSLPLDSSVGIKPISESNSKRLIRMAIQFAIDNQRKSVTFMHKGNVMKYTEGFFRKWGYELALSEFGDRIMTETEYENRNQPETDRIIIKDRIADNMFQQILTRTEEYDVIATMNLNGDYISDAIGGMVGGIGFSPGGNIGDKYAMFEPIHGSAPKYAGLDVANPTAMMLAGAQMLKHIGLVESSETIEKTLWTVYKEGKTTQDVARMTGKRGLKCSEFGKLVVDNLKNQFKSLNGS